MIKSSMAGSPEIPLMALQPRYVIRGRQLELLCQQWSGGPTLGGRHAAQLVLQHGQQTRRKAVTQPVLPRVEGGK